MKDLTYLQLWDKYGGLLTDRQREVCELYYVFDLSLTEIAEQKEISKQCVSDTLNKSRALLDEYESKLHLNEQMNEYSHEVSNMMTDVVRALDRLKADHPEIEGRIEEIKSLVKVGEIISLDEDDRD